MKKDPQLEVARLVSMSLAFHNLNKAAESLYGLSLVQFHVLSALRERPGCSPQRLATLTGMHPSSLTQSLKRLQKKKALFIDEDPRDSRCKILGITRHGAELLNTFTQNVPTLLADPPSGANEPELN